MSSRLSPSAITFVLLLALVGSLSACAPQKDENGKSNGSSGQTRSDGTETNDAANSVRNAVSTFGPEAAHQHKDYALVTAIQVQGDVDRADAFELNDISNRILSCGLKGSALVCLDHPYKASTLLLYKESFEEARDEDYKKIMLEVRAVSTLESGHVFYILTERELDSKGAQNWSKGLL